MQASKKCTDLLILANAAYEQGKYEQVVRILETDIQVCGFDKLEREQVLKLLTAALSKLDEQEKAEEYVYQLLKNNPNYAVQTTVDPIAFVNVLSKFKRSPRASFGFAIGQYLPFINSSKSFNLWTETDVSSTYSSVSGLSISLIGQYHINKNWSLSVEPRLAILKYNQDINVTDLVNLYYSERSTLITVPVLIGYKIFDRNNLSTTIKGGFYKSFSSAYMGKLDYQLPEQSIIETERNPVIARNMQNVGFQTGLDFCYTKNKLQFSLQISYASDLKAYNNVDKLYNSNNLHQDYNYTENEIYMNHMDFKVGVAYTFSYRIKRKYLLK